MSKDIRRSVIAGTWYPGSPRALRSDIENYFRNVSNVKVDGKIIGLIAPHAGYAYSGQVAAFAYETIKGGNFEAVIVIGPSHRAYFHGVAVYDRGGYETPLGIVPVDAALASEIMSQNEMIFYEPSVHLQEHSIEIQLPFLQVALGEFRFVPLVMGDQSASTCETLAESISRTIGDRRILVIGSSDLSHFHSYEKAVALDSIVLRHIESMDHKSLQRDLEGNTCEACGGGPTVVTIMVSKKLGADRAKLLKYANSGDITGDRSGVVGYASAVFYGSK